MKIAIVDAGGANLNSVRYGFERLGARVRVVDAVEDLEAADALVLPGVGAAAPAMARLEATGLAAALRTIQRPLLGICLGFQLLHERSAEGGVDCLGLLSGVVEALRPGAGRRVPHMGWNALTLRGQHPLVAGLANGDWVWYANSYAAPVSDHCLATYDHGGIHAAISARGARFGAQFHPERSGAAGAKVLENFLRLAAVPGALSVAPC